MSPSPLSRIYGPIDWLLWLISRIGAVAMVMIVAITVYDVMTRYFGLPKFPAFTLDLTWLGFAEPIEVPETTSTKLQDAEWWTHTILFSTVIAYAYTRQAHVRIDLFRERLPRTAKYLFEMFGVLFFLMPFAGVGAYYTYGYAMRSYIQDEGSTSTVGLDNIWIVKFFLLALFVTLLLAGLSQFLKSLDGLLGNLTEEESARVLGGGH